MNKTLVCLHWHFVIDFLYKHLQPPPPPPIYLMSTRGIRSQVSIDILNRFLDWHATCHWMLIDTWVGGLLTVSWSSVSGSGVDQDVDRMLTEYQLRYWLSINWLLIKGRLKVDWWYQSTLHYGCLLLIWSMHSKQLFCHHWFTKVKIPQLKNLPLKVCASLMSFSLTAPTLLDSTFKVIFFDLYVAMASLMASIEPSTSPKWPRKKCLISEYLQCPEN